MDCNEFESERYLYLDGEMNFLRQVTIRRHLRRCPPCEEAYLFEVRLRTRVQRACCEDPPADLAERIRQALEE